jgi:hypothetical protein
MIPVMLSRVSIVMAVSGLDPGTGGELITGRATVKTRHSAPT